jgi:hypothetical protein
MKSLMIISKTQNALLPHYGLLSMVKGVSRSATMRELREVMRSP